VRVAAQLQLKTHRDRLALTADTDMLTGIPNRRHFETVMQNEWNRALRYDKPLCLIMIDVDYFKRYNDHYGHAAGDDCLKAIADSLDSTLRRASDMVARLGGEEFVCLLPEVTQNKPSAWPSRYCAAFVIRHCPRRLDCSRPCYRQPGTGLSKPESAHNLANLTEARQIKHLSGQA